MLVVGVVAVGCATVMLRSKKCRLGALSVRGQLRVEWEVEREVKEEGTICRAGRSCNVWCGDSRTLILAGGFANHGE